MGEIDDGLWCEPLNFNNWTISFNEDVIEKDEQETALCNCVNGCTDFVKVGKKNKIQNIEMDCSVDGKIGDIVFNNENNWLCGFDVRLNYEIGKLPRKLKKAMKQVDDGFIGFRGSKWINRWVAVRKRYKSYLFKNCRFVAHDNDDIDLDDSTLTMTMEYSNYESN